MKKIVALLLALVMLTALLSAGNVFADTGVCSESPDGPHRTAAGRSAAPHDRRAGRRRAGPLPGPLLLSHG